MQKKHEEEQEEFNQFFQGLRGMTPNKSILTAHEKINEKCRRAKEVYSNCLDNIMKGISGNSLEGGDHGRMLEKRSFKEIPLPNGQLPIFIETQPKTIYSQVGLYNRKHFSPNQESDGQPVGRIPDFELSRYSFNPQI
mmetsp:Transcript_23975/g.36776  ORF Transcript_23975/g.36776 Transcript_23975/m.36776 type:complete len:138 (-) Transcript_23975:3042-3455(-)